MVKQQQQQQQRRVHFEDDCGWEEEEEEARSRRGHEERKERRKQKEERELEEYSHDLGQIYKAYTILKSNDKLAAILGVCETDPSFRTGLAGFLRAIDDNNNNNNEDLAVQLERFQRDTRCFDELYELKSVSQYLYRLSSNRVFRPDSLVFETTQPTTTTTTLPLPEPESPCTYVVVNSTVRTACNCGRHHHHHEAAPELRAQDVVDAIYATTTASLHEDHLAYSTLLVKGDKNNSRKRTRSSDCAEFDKPPGSKGRKISAV